MVVNAVSLRTDIYRVHVAMMLRHSGGDGGGGVVVIVGGNIIALSQLCGMFQFDGWRPRRRGYMNSG